MTRFMKLSILGAALAVPSTAAFATTISIGYSLTGNGTPTTVATDAATPGYASFASGANIGGFTFNSVAATGYPIMAQGNLSSTSIDVASATGGTIYIYVTETGLTSPTGTTPFLSGFTTNLLTGMGSSIVESTLYSTANGGMNLYGGSILGAATFTGLGTSSFTNSAPLTGTYSLTEKYAITLGAGGNANSTVTISPAATPEPSSLALLGTGLLGVAGVVRRKLVKA